ncbi:ribonuclease H family protein [Promicromonospora sukumoe]|uniref:ribonuclease H family protein n=1 Tax=Promicromonospora sukumoe TaxID=88382 RepID=UPI00036EEB5D|nr:ribonuclease H [Promicromonospora sukumoe]
MDAVIIVSTHGSAAPGGAIGWAWINHAGGQFDSGGAAQGNDQVAALSALLRAIDAHPGSEPLLVESGSQYAVRSVSEWSEGWKRNGWRSPAGEPVPNLDLVQDIDRAVTERTGPVRFHWVRGHVGNPYNERVDQLAGFAAEEWAAGRGGVGEMLVPDGGMIPDAELQGAGLTGEPRESVAPATRPTPVVTGAGAGRTWESDTLF